MSTAKAAKSPADMKALAAMIACPHQWGPEKMVTLMDEGHDDKLRRQRNGLWRTCTACGTHRIKWPDGTGTLYSPEALSTSQPEST